MRDILPELNNKEYIENVYLNYDVHFCREEEVDELIEFIDNYWKKDHIFVVSRELFNWQHHDVKNKRYNFVIAKSKSNGEIHSILGFVPTSQFDSSIVEKEVWPCIWKSRDDIHVKGLGVTLYHYMKSQLKVDTISILGISEVALSIYKHWDFSTGKIEQYYYPNMEMEEVLSAHRQESTSSLESFEGWKIEELTLRQYNAISDSDEIWKKVNKYKSKNYYIGRYIMHPLYNYTFYGIKNEGKTVSVIIVRECGNGDAKCLRIVDYIGDVNNLKYIMSDLKALMTDREYEYIDFVVVGIECDILEKAGFINRKNHPQTIIPNYFEPFTKMNVDLDYAFKTVDSTAEALFFKADADQDRPNMLL